MTAPQAQAAQTRLRTLLRVHFGPVVDRDLPYADYVVALLHHRWSSTAGQPLRARYIDLVAEAERLLNEVVERTGAGPHIACKAGCDYCCRSNAIHLSEVEASVLIAHLQATPEADQEALGQRLANSQPTNNDSRVRRSPCALLVNGLCSVYEARPMACRTFLSFSAPSCAAKLRDSELPAQIFPPGIILYHAVCEVMEMGDEAWVYEINSLLRRVWSDEGKRKAWAAGQGLPETTIALNVPLRARKPIPSVLL